MVISTQLREQLPSLTRQNSDIRILSVACNAAFSQCYPQAVDNIVDKLVNCLQSLISQSYAIALFGGVGYIPLRG